MRFTLQLEMIAFPKWELVAGERRKDEEGEGGEGEEDSLFVLVRRDYLREFNWMVVVDSRLMLLRVQGDGFEDFEVDG